MFEPDAPEDEFVLETLFEDGRFEEADRLLTALLIEVPEHGGLRALHALCLSQLGRPDEALDAANAAIEADRGDAYAYWVRGALLLERHRFKDALADGNRALSLEPTDPAGAALVAHAHAALKQWDEALRAAERGLTLDPKNESCLTVKALALRHNTDEDWTAELDNFPQSYPASGWARATRGWGALEKGDALGAQTDFEQALALDPTSEWARDGLIEASKATNPIYRRILTFFLWFDRIPSRTRWFIILGGIFAYGRLRRLAEMYPNVAPVIYPLMALWVLFILLSWTATPLSDFVFSRTSQGAQIVRGDRLRSARLVTSVVAIAAALGGAAAVTASERIGLAAMAFGFLVIPVSAVYQGMKGWPRTSMALYAGATALAATAALVAPGTFADSAFLTALVLAVLGSWLGAFMISRVPKR